MSFKSLQKGIDDLLSSIKTVEDTNTYECSKCKDKEIITHNKQQLDEYHEWCECHWKKEVIRELSKSGISRKQMEMRFKDFVTDDSDKDVQTLREDMKHKATEFYSSPAGMFFAGGNTGGGKTTICTLVAKNVASKFKGFVYMKWTDEMQKASKQFGELDPMYWEKVKNIDVLYIDDFLKNKQAKRYGSEDEDYHILRDVKEFEYDYAFNLIKYRADNEKVTIVSSEYSLSEIERFNAALQGRMIEMIRKGGKSFFIPREDKYNYRKHGKF